MQFMCAVSCTYHIQVRASSVMIFWLIFRATAQSNIQYCNQQRRGLLPASSALAPLAALLPFGHHGRMADYDVRTFQKHFQYISSTFQVHIQSRCQCFVYPINGRGGHTGRCRVVWYPFWIKPTPTLWEWTASLSSLLGLLNGLYGRHLLPDSVRIDFLRNMVNMYPPAQAQDPALLPWAPAAYLLQLA